MEKVESNDQSELGIGRSVVGTEIGGLLHSEKGINVDVVIYSTLPEAKSI